MALRGPLRPRKVRRRREMLPRQVGFVCAVLALVCCASGLFGSLGHKTASASKHVLPDTWRNRKLMAPMNGTQTAKNCTDPAIHEFPTDLFSNKERQHGAVLLHILGALYMFYALAIVCDDFFVPSLEKICEKLHLSEDVAGATFMAAGSSTPELFASVIGVFITHGDVGVGTIVGSAVFNILCIIGVCGLFAGQVVRLTWWAVCRDSVYYTLSVIVLIAFIYDEEIVWWEGLVLIILYVFYILIMKAGRPHFCSRLSPVPSVTAAALHNFWGHHLQQRKCRHWVSGCAILLQPFEAAWVRVLSELPVRNIIQP